MVQECGLGEVRSWPIAGYCRGRFRPKADVHLRGLRQAIIEPMSALREGRWMTREEAVFEIAAELLLVIRILAEPSCDAR